MFPEGYQAGYINKWAEYNVGNIWEVTAQLQPIVAMQEWRLYVIWSSEFSRENGNPECYDNISQILKISW